MNHRSVSQGTTRQGDVGWDTLGLGKTRQDRTGQDRTRKSKL